MPCRRGKRGRCVRGGVGDGNGAAGIGTRRENVENYDLMLNTARLGTEGAVRAIREYLKIKGLAEE